MVVHSIQPIYNKESRILILGTFPSVKSREGQFFYHHPQNRFWKVLSCLFQSNLPSTIEEKKQLLLNNHIAVWDVIQSCDITGSSDSSIRNVVANDLSMILKEANIQNIYANGNKSYELYNRYCIKHTNRDIIGLPSTSPANASYSLERLEEAWKVILNDLCMERHGDYSEKSRETYIL